MKRTGFALIMLLSASIALACAKDNSTGPTTPTTPETANFISLEMFVCPDTLRIAENCTVRAENDSLVVNSENVEKIRWDNAIYYVYGNLSWDSAGSDFCSNLSPDGRCFVEGAFEPDTKTSLDIFVLVPEAREYRLHWQLRGRSETTLADTTLTYYGKLAPGAVALNRFALVPNMSRR